MKPSKIIDISTQRKPRQRKQCIAFHGAGHATAVYLNNKTHGAQPAFFKLCFKDVDAQAEDSSIDYRLVYGDYIAKVEKLRWLQSISASFDSPEQAPAENDAKGGAVRDYLTAFELDIINLLIGPLAQAKYIADADDEIFNYKLVNLQALKNYGGKFDLALIDEYAKSFSLDEKKRNEKLNELFMMAFYFVNDYDNWKAITKLAGYLLETDKNTISYEEVAAALG